jgi:hypothetical protein
MEEEKHTIGTSMSSSLLLYVTLFSFSLSLSLYRSLHLSFPCGSSKDCVGAKVNSSATRCRAARIPDLIQTDLLPQSRLDQRSGGYHRSPYMITHGGGILR